MSDVPVSDVPASGQIQSFSDLGVPAVVVHALRRQGVARPRDIQVQSIPPILDGRDVVGRAPTGSGKTLAFGVPMLLRLKGSASKPSRPRALILAPTRELADQITTALDEPALALGMRLTALTGGVPISRQKQTLARGIDLIVATPGRLIDHLRKRTLQLDDLVVTAVDEADHLAELGFMPQLTEILNATPAGSQRLLFSATLEGDVGSLVSRYLTEPESVHTDLDVSPTQMAHHVLVVDKSDKPAIVQRLACGAGQILLFVRTQTWADRLTEQLSDAGVDVDVLHGGKSQAYRTRALTRFSDGQTPVLVATDVAARGIHVDDVALVVHADPPSDADSYVHRAGRTARAGANGTVVTVVTEQERDEALRVIDAAGISPTVHRVGPRDGVVNQLAGNRPASAAPVRPQKPTPVSAAPQDKGSYRGRADRRAQPEGQRSRRGGPKPGSRSRPTVRGRRPH